MITDHSHSSKSNFFFFFPGLVFDLATDRLYWVNIESSSIQYYDFVNNSVKLLILRGNAARPTSVVPYFGSIYYSDQEDQAIHKADMTTGGNDTVLRNNTGIY